MKMHAGKPGKGEHGSTKTHLRSDIEGRRGDVEHERTCEEPRECLACSIHEAAQSKTSLCLVGSRERFKIPTRFLSA